MVKEEITYPCYDCDSQVKIQGEEVISGKMLTFNGRARFKCDKCYKKNPDWIDTTECEVYSRIVGYLRPVQQWNPAKAEEFKERKMYDLKSSKKHV